MTVMLPVRFAPMQVWPHDRTHDRRGRHAFRASWTNTLDLLDRELRILRATNIVIGIGLKPDHLRLDGWPRSDAPNPIHPGVELSFDSGMLAQLDPTVRRGRQLIALARGDARAALKRAHPDANGSALDFIAIQEAMNPARRLVYATDVCEHWQHNVRSIALGLDRLRAVERFGISRRGEQYAGFRAALTKGAS